eukprot:65672-Pleurochrysis_carterae.AAC.1
MPPSRCATPHHPAVEGPANHKRRGGTPPGPPRKRSPATAWFSADGRSRRLSDGGKRAPVQTRLERSKGSSATPEGTRGMRAEAAPTEGDPGQPRPGMIAVWRPSGLVKAKPPPP